MIYCQLILQLCFPDEHFVLITSERAKFDCRGDTSQFCNAESFMRQCQPLPGKAVTLTTVLLADIFIIHNQMYFS